MPHVILKDNFGRIVQRRLHGRKLHQHLGAVPSLLYPPLHMLQVTDGPGEAVQDCFCVFMGVDMGMGVLVLMLMLMFVLMFMFVPMFMFVQMLMFMLMLMFVQMPMFRPVLVM